MSCREEEAIFSRADCGILKLAELGTPIAELVRQVGISEQIFCQWKRKFIGLEVDQAEQLKRMAEENSRLKDIIRLRGRAP